MPVAIIRTRPPAAAGALLVAVITGSLLSAAIAVLFRGVATIPSGFSPFTPSAYIPLITLGDAAGLAGWLVVRRRAGDPATVMRVLVPAVVLVSLVPDVLVGITKSLAGTTWPGIAGLMVMHLTVAAVAVTTFAKLLPLDRP
jgi:hypothetical protein